MTKINSLLKYIRTRYPESLAESWDPVGHLIGDENGELKKIWIMVEATPKKILEACQQKVDLLLIHHPLFFPKDRGLKQIVAPHFAYEAVRAGLNVYCAHTNFDVGGLDAMKRLAQEMGVSFKGRLNDQASGSGYGFHGKFKKPMTPKDLSRQIRKVFGEDSYWQTGELPRLIHTIGFTPGKGSSFLADARRQGLDVFLTGEVGYHAAKDHAIQGGTVIELGHTQSEKSFVLSMKKDCEEFFKRLRIRTSPKVEVFFESIQKKVRDD